MTSSRTVALIIQFGDYDDLIKCIDGLTQTESQKVDIYVVDNNPPEERKTSLYAKYTPSLQVIFPEKNLGYSGGCNAGLKELLMKDYEYFFILNNDTFIQSSDIIKMEHALDNNKNIGLMGPVVYDTRHNEHYLGMHINWKRGRTIYNRTNTPIDPDTMIDVDVIEGCGMMLTRSALQKAGFFDTRYFLYWEDTDLNLRIQKAGFRTVITCNVIMNHTASQSTGHKSPLKEYYMTRNSFLFFSKHSKGFLSRKLLFNRMVTLKLKSVIRNLKKRNFTIAKIQYLGIWDFIRNNLGPSSRFNHTP